MLTPKTRSTLLAIARASIEAAARGVEPTDPIPDDPALHRPGAAFVTIRVRGELRGCIGHVSAEQPLWISIREMAAAAATRDERFDPLKPEDLPDVRLEISVLSPRRRIAGPEDIVIGRDGLYVRRGPSTGLLLPQVAPEHGWLDEEFLAQTCRKAGLPPDAWTDPQTRIESFTAEVFGD
jgi:AmmeMemoRadiSam system protein A